MMKTSELIRRFTPYYKKHTRVMVMDLFCASMTTLCDLFMPMLARSIGSKAAVDVNSLTVQFIVQVGLLYLVLRIIDAAANFYMAANGHVMGAKLEGDMREDLFHHLQTLSFGYYSDTKIGQIMSRITSDLFEVTEFAHHCPEEFLIAGIKIIVSFVVLCGMNVPLTLMMFSVLPAMLFIARKLNKQMRKAFRERNIQVGEINAQVEDSLLGIRVVKSFANEKIEEEKFRKSNDVFFQAKKRAYAYMALFSTNNRVFDGLMYLMLMVGGGFFIRSGSVSPADFMAYLLYAGVLLASIRRIVEFMEQFQRGMTGIERFYEIMDAPAEIFDAPDAVALADVKGRVDFVDVGFRYGDGSKDVLHGLNLHVEPGQSIALVGPSGGGKTTLCNLLPRFYDASEGSVMIDGHDVRTVTQESLRNAIGVVQQDVYLFSGTVADNIVYGRPGASREAVIEAAKLAGAHDFIMGLPNGYDTYVGERGVKLSGGQKQRISIARVFLKDPPILVLDEATSALDNESELLVQQSLEKLAKGRTVFTVAHRLTTIRGADVIWVLTENGVEESGSHRELIEKGGLYARLYEMYTREA